MKITGAHHASFAVRELARARRFYEDVLGLAPIPRPELGLAGIWYGVGNAEVHLIETPAGMDVGAPPPGLSPLANHVAFAIDDYDAAVAHLHRAGVEVLEAGRDRGQLWVRDLDGNVIELIRQASI